MDDLRPTIVRLLSNMGSAKEIQQYLKRFSQLDAARFALVKVGGAILRDELDALLLEVRADRERDRLALPPADGELGQADAQRWIDEHPADLWQLDPLPDWTQPQAATRAPPASRGWRREEGPR